MRLKRSRLHNVENELPRFIISYEKNSSLRYAHIERTRRALRIIGIIASAACSYSLNLQGQ
jgi:hypothetical protein